MLSLNYLLMQCVPAMTMTMTMKNIYLTINQQIAKYSSKLLLL